MTIKHFQLVRSIDETGMSGTGAVAEGVQLPNGQCVLWWLPGPKYSVGIYASIEDLEYIHGHGDRKTTKVVFL